MYVNNVLKEETAEHGDRLNVRKVCEESKMNPRLQSCLTVERLDIDKYRVGRKIRFWMESLVEVMLHFRPSKQKCQTSSPICGLDSKREFSYEETELGVIGAEAIVKATDLDIIQG